jgi:hypothetical protein
VAHGHHILFEAANWRAHKVNNELRTKSGLIVPLDWDTHSALHAQDPIVPAPGYRFGAAILRAYRDNPDNHVRSIDNLMFAVQEAATHPRIKDTERKLGELIIFALETQREFIVPDSASYPTLF